MLRKIFFCSLFSICSLLSGKEVIDFGDSGHPLKFYASGKHFPVIASDGTPMRLFQAGKKYYEIRLREKKLYWKAPVFELDLKLDLPEKDSVKIVALHLEDADGELVIFGDVKQNIYRRSLDETKEIHTPIPGQWTKRLNIGHRFNNPRIASLSMAFQQHFFGSLPTDDIAPDLSLGFNTRDISYEYLSASSSGDVIAGKCLEIISANSLSLKNTVVLSQTNDILRVVEKAYRTRTGQSPMTTCETQEYYDYLKETSERFDDDIRRIRNNKKTHFTMMTDQIKMSSIYSYKGWEADNVILLIQPIKEYVEVEDSIMAMPELVYTAITRARNNLFIINLGNTVFHNFFSTANY